MKVAILHHHLHTGGVTRVIETQCEAFQLNRQSFDVIVGDDDHRQPGGQPPHIIPELSYLPKDLSQSALDAQRQTLYAALKAWTETHILHIHNLNLGKNPILNLVLCDLVHEGAKVFNHCHDFAEDRRPQNMEHLQHVIESCYGQSIDEVLYPTSPNMAWAVINSNDHNRLRSHGVAEERILSCPNAISLPSPAIDGNSRERLLRQFQLSEDQRLVLYPVRGIERKNLAEWLFLAALFKDQATFLITQPPKNPDEKALYEPWVQFAHDHQLNVIFEAGLKADFSDLMHGCDLVVSTSTNEGFGLGFLEPWTYGKTVVGRDLPHVTNDFKQHGMTFTKLYSQLLVHGQDFPCYDSDDQKAFILRAFQDHSQAMQWRGENHLDDFLNPLPATTIHNNLNIIQQQYSVRSYGERLLNFYGTSFQ